MTDDAAVLSIDFLCGFAIFMVAFIYVATMIPGLLIGLQSKTIDYDAVAYRTGVILVEDPGMDPSWEMEKYYNNGYPDYVHVVQRFGLALSRNDPNILSSAKVDRFFCSTFFLYPDDYHTRVIFGDYPYRFNISFKESGDNVTRSVGDTKPDGYGYIRRLVKVKSVSNATIGSATIQANGYIGKENVTQTFSIHLNTTKLLTSEKDPAYQIDPRTEQIMINLTDLESCVNTSPFVTDKRATLEDLYINKNNVEKVRPFDPEIFVYVDGNPDPVTALPVTVQNNLSIVFTPGFLEDLTTEYGVSSSLPYADLYVKLQFKPNEGDWYLNNTVSGPFEYDYNPKNVTQPVLKDGVLEVAVW
ncbi:MAG: hypothetical protein WC342_00125 [Methanoregula sp.]|jgi:hypothetical protein